MKVRSQKKCKTHQRCFWRLANSPNLLNLTSESCQAFMVWLVISCEHTFIEFGILEMFDIFKNLWMEIWRKSHRIANYHVKMLPHVWFPNPRYLHTKNSNSTSKRFHFGKFHDDQLSRSSWGTFPARTLLPSISQKSSKQDLHRSFSDILF